MKAFVAVTDTNWFQYLASLSDVDEVNFWQPSGGRGFWVLQPGEPLLFKLHSPTNAIVGGGFFAGHSVIPASLAWESFTEKNGAASFEDMLMRIERYVRQPVTGDHQIGCILLEQPFFWTEDQWIPQPIDWKPNIVSGKTYDLAVSPVGTWLWEQVHFRLLTKNPEFEDAEMRMFGDARPVRPRLGQGSFRVLVIEAYERRCAASGERILPVLEAAHIRPVSMGGGHRINNGLLLRSDFHTLFDKGYLTVTPALALRVSPQLRDDFENGAYYYGFDGSSLRPPADAQDRPSRELLEWHGDVMFRG